MSVLGSLEPHWNLFERRQGEVLPPHAPSSQSAVSRLVCMPAGSHHAGLCQSGPRHWMPILGGCWRAGKKNAGTQLWCHCHATKAWLHASYRLQIALDACVIFCYMHSHALPPSLHQHADAAFKKTQDCAPRYLVTMPTICLTYCSWQDNEGLSRWVEANLTLIQECETFLLRKRTVY